jgi:hypothetical protein
MLHFVAQLFGGSIHCISLNSFQTSLVLLIAVTASFAYSFFTNYIFFMRTFFLFEAVHFDVLINNRLILNINLLFLLSLSCSYGDISYKLTTFTALLIFSWTLIISAATFSSILLWN